METKAQQIIHLLCGRKGFDDWWYNIDEEDQIDIRAEIAEIILKPAAECPGENPGTGCDPH